MLWDAYYAIEPYTGHLKYLANIEGVLNKRTRAVLPDECDLNNPLEDKFQSSVQVDSNRKTLQKLFTELADDYLRSQGKPSVQDQIAAAVSSPQNVTPDHAKHR